MSLLGYVLNLKLMFSHEDWSLGTFAVTIGLVCCYHLVEQVVAFKAFVEASLIPSQFLLQQFPCFDLLGDPFPVFEFQSSNLGALSQGLPGSVCLLFNLKLCSMLCRGFGPFHILHQGAELLRGSKSMIEHHVSHMSITDERLEERMKRATLLVPSVRLEVRSFLWEQLVCFVVGLRFLQLMTISQVMVGAPPFKPLSF